MEDDKKIDDPVLLNDLKSGDKRVFEFIFKKYYKRLCLYAQKYVRDTQTAEEIVSKVMMRLWEKRETINVYESLSSYLFKSVYNEALNYLHSFSFRQKPTDSIHPYLNHSYSEPSILQKLYAEELELKIKKGIQNLPDRCQYIFYLSRYQGLTHNEIAVKLNISVSTVENQIGIALHKLRDSLKKE